MASLLACPFCREFYLAGEATQCGSCGIELQTLETLPASHDALLEQALRGELPSHDDTPLPWSDWSRGRAWLFGCGVLGLVWFFCPWVEVTGAEPRVFSAFDLAQARAPWLFGGALGWFILLPLIVTRRTPYQMRGVRVICTLFCLMTLGEVLLLSLIPPARHEFFRVDLTWHWALWASALTSLTGAFFAVRFGAGASAPEIADNSASTNGV